jgi:hypothetical protein
MIEHRSDGSPIAPEERSLFEPWERILLLTIALDDVPDAPSTEAMRLVLFACVAVVKQMQGRVTRREAFAATARANEAIRELARAPHDFVQVYATEHEISIGEATKRLLKVAASRVSALSGYAKRKRETRARQELA